VTSAHPASTEAPPQRLFEQLSEGALLGLRSIQTDLAEFVRLADTTIATSRRTGEQFESIVERTAEMAGSSRVLADDLAGAQAEFETMRNVIRDVLRALSGIDDIAHETNMLSLNAAVEAARAGDAGAGFAVVANQVKVLSGQTAGIVSSLSELIERVSASTQVVRDAIHRAAEHSQATAGTLSELNTATKATFVENQDVARNVTCNNERIFVSLAKVDHVIWKVNTYDSILKRKPVFEYVDDKNCRLGKWYLHGDGVKTFARVPSFASMSVPHSRVHEGTRKVLDNLGGDFERIEVALQSMEEGSHGVFSCLDRMIEEKEAQRQRERERQRASAARG
jgi:uncharacterized protein YoxC